MRIGILGGTFDPPHNGHMALAEAARDTLQLDEVIWMPAFQNPLKEKGKGTLAKHRMEMVKLITAGHTDMAVSDSEISRRGPSYAVDTVSEMQYVRPADYWFIVGADALKTLPKWKQPERLLKLCRIAVAVRPPLGVADTLMHLPPYCRELIDEIQMKPTEVSSSEIRDKVAKGHAINLWVPKGVIKYIEEHKLYRY